MSVFANIVPRRVRRFIHRERPEAEGAERPEAEGAETIFNAELAEVAEFFSKKLRVLGALRV